MFKVLESKLTCRCGPCFYPSAFLSKVPGLLSQQFMCGIKTWTKNVCNLHIYLYIYTYIYVYMHIYIYAYIHVFTCIIPMDCFKTEHAAIFAAPALPRNFTPTPGNLHILPLLGHLHVARVRGSSIFRLHSLGLCDQLIHTQSMSYRQDIHVYTDTLYHTYKCIRIQYTYTWYVCHNVCNIYIYVIYIYIFTYL